MPAYIRRFTIVCTAPLYAVANKGKALGRTIYDASQHKLNDYHGVNSLIPDTWVHTALPSIRLIRDIIVDAGMGAWLFTIDLTYMNVVHTCRYRLSCT